MFPHTESRGEGGIKLLFFWYFQVALIRFVVEIVVGKNIVGNDNCVAMLSKNIDTS